MNLINLMKSVKNAKEMLLGTIDAIKGIFSAKETKEVIANLSKSIQTHNLPRPSIKANADILALWVEPEHNYPMLSVSAMSKKDLFDAVSDVSKSLDISDDAEVWALVQWMKEVDKENLA